MRELFLLQNDGELRSAMKMNTLLAVALTTVAGCVSLSTSCRTAVEVQQAEARVQKLIVAATDALRQGTPEALERAQGALEVARDLSPNDPRILDGLGCVEWRREHYGLAAEFFNRAIALEPKYDRPYVHLALIAERRGRKEVAKEYLQTAIKLNPLNFRARNNLAVMLLEEGYPHAAVRQLLQAYNSGAQKDVVVLHNLKQAAELE